MDSTSEVTELHHEALFVRFSPSGDVVAVLTSDSVITLYHTKEVRFIIIIQNERLEFLEIQLNANENYSCSFNCIKLMNWAVLFKENI